ncbi:response regulator [bacterium]|nr:response regulator [bacterium]
MTIHRNMTKKCLLVDDDPAMLDMLAQCMKEMGFDPVTAADGDEGWTAFQDAHPSMVISDIHMPNRNGLLLLKDIKSVHPEVPVILITGWVHYKTVLNMGPPKPEAFFEKPFSLDQLRATVARIAPEMSGLPA